MKSYLISSLFLAGFNNDAADPVKMLDSIGQHEKDDHNFWNLMDRNLPVTLIGHSSHGSHASHGSHRSSSTSRIYPTPSPSPSIIPKPNFKNNSTTPESVLPKVPGTSAQFKRIATRVQLYLYALGFYNGEIDGLVDLDTQVAIIKFQIKNGLKATGKIDNELVKAMNVSTE